MRSARPRRRDGQKEISRRCDRGTRPDSRFYCNLQALLLKHRIHLLARIMFREVTMHRMTRVSSYAVAAACLSLAAVGPLSQAKGQPAASKAASDALDYEFFKTKVQPVFLEKRAGH